MCLKELHSRHIIVIDHSPASIGAIQNPDILIIETA